MFVYLAVNEESDVFTLEGLRAGLTYAIDRETLAKTYYRGFGIPANLPASPSSPYYSEVLAARYAYDPVRYAQSVSQHLLPEDAAVETFAGEEIGVYDCGEYAVVLQTVPSGNFDSTVKSVSGFAPDQLTVLESRMDGVRRYDWVWTAAAEVGDVLCRAAVLDDGKYHYCLSVIAPAGKAGALTQTWNQLFGSFRLE
jgi:hypothetical protein